MPINYDDIFLTAQGERLRIKYNPSITNFKKVFNETITPTLGSKYPFIRRNGMQEYQQFTIGGLISYYAEADTDNLVVNGTTLININDQLSDTFDVQSEIEFEKAFRDKVLAFLYADNIKLFESAQEGNMLIKLNNITLTPNQQLGRRIYSFSAQATEVDGIENISKYNIYSAGGTANE